MASVPEFRPLTQDEISSFKWRHPIALLNIPSEGKYIQDDKLGGYVLVFEKVDGTVLYTLTDKDYSAGDPSKTGYIIKETTKAVIENAQKVGGGIVTGFKLATPILILIVIIIFRNEIKVLWKQLTKQ